MAGRKRKAQDAELEQPARAARAKRNNDNVVDDGEVTTNFTRLQPRTKRISEDVVRTKWVRPTPALQSRIRDLFKAAETPVLMSVKDEKRRIEAQTTLNAVIKRLSARVPRIPLPPNTKEMYLDYERLLGGNRALEAQLTPATHSIDLFRSEIAREKRRLEEDRTRLETLKKDARAEEGLRKRQKKSVHPILRASSSVSKGEDRDIVVSGVVVEDPGESQSLKIEDDPALAPIVAQLRSHLESIQGNTSFLEGFEEEQRRTRAALDNVLFEKLESSLYEKLAAS
ncbi:MAG: Cytochrome c oxidase assembly protein cox11, mitochondrial [Chaenotheca gracillima]|nr:MAG: Cytochrome c oxidase assembly protein cox11, mitochondrial [Chaenotheca gracillima]